MPAITVNVPVIHENRILLTKREDFKVWCLPSGGVEEGESLAQAAVRETKEETGDDLSFGHRKRIEDALHGIGGSVAVTQELVLPVGQKISPKDMVKARKLSRESRLRYYQQLMEQATMQVRTDVGER